MMDNYVMAARVLVVDDERDVCRLLTFSLEQAGFKVRPLKPGYEDLLKAGFKKAESTATPAAK